MRSRTAQAPTIVMSAPLTEEFGYNYAVRVFGQQAIDSLPILKAGKNKGKPKGCINWLKTTAKGYHPLANGGAGEGQILWAWIGDSRHTSSQDAPVGYWLDRWQCLSGTYRMIGDERARFDVRDRIKARSDDFDGRYDDMTLDEICDQLTRSAELRAKWDVEDRSKIFANDPHRRAFDEALRVNRTFGPTI